MIFFLLVGGPDVEWALGTGSGLGPGVPENFTVQVRALLFLMAPLFIWVPINNGMAAQGQISVWAGESNTRPLVL